MRLVMLAGMLFALLTASAEARRVGFIPLPKGHEAKDLTLGPDGKMWYVSARNRSQNSYKFTPLIIGRVTPGGDVRSVRAPMRINGGAVLEPTPDGALMVGWTSWNRQGKTQTYIATGGMGRITTAGAFTNLTGSATFGPSLRQRREDLLVAPDGSTWYTQSHVIGRLQTGAAGLTNSSAPVDGAQWMDTFDLTRAADGNVWYVGNHGRTGTIGRALPTEDNTGVALEEVHSASGNVRFVSLTPGPGQTLWFLTYDQRKGVVSLARLDLATGTVTVVNDDLRGLPDLVFGPDGNFWTAAVGGDVSSLERITPSGKLTRFKLGKNVAPDGLAVGSDKRLWFADYSKKRARLGRFAVPGVR